jgi:hypothetical protein
MQARYQATLQPDDSSEGRRSLMPPPYASPFLSGKALRIGTTKHTQNTKFKPTPLVIKVTASMPNRIKGLGTFVSFVLNPALIPFSRKVASPA